VERLGKLGRLDHRLRRDGGQVVAIERDVEDAEWNRMSLHLLDLFGDALADRHAAATDADDDEIACAPIFLDDLDGHSANRAIHPRAIEEPFLDVHRVKESLRSERRE